MKSVIDFRVDPKLPESLNPLRELAFNLWWSWNPPAIDLFRQIDSDLWEQTRHNPVLLLYSLLQERLEELAKDRSFLEFMGQVHKTFKAYMDAETWFDSTFGPVEQPYIAYFSMEFGLTECLRLYSGGLGVLSGDHLKSASDLGLPLVGVSLCFQHGYFRQYLNIDGWQQEKYPVNDFHLLPLQQVRNNDGELLKVDLHFPGRVVGVQVWRCDVGRVCLYLLDSNLAENEFADHDITGHLYGGDSRTRIQQELVLGIGGVRVLHAMGICPMVCHINEGHAAFSSLERIRLAMRDHGLSFRDARVAMGGGNIFTTHTPVAAGFDVFPTELMEEFFANYVAEMGIPMEKLLSMGQGEFGSENRHFNMAVMALKNSTFTNAVSALHGEVSRKMVAKGFVGFPLEEIPIDHVTNGTHLRSWMSKDMMSLLDRYIGSSWHEKPNEPDLWQQIYKIPNSELWRTHERRRERLVGFARQRLRKQLINRGASLQEIDRAEELLDPEALTIGFARRFATYKRATLLFRDRDRLKRLLMDPKRPMQLIFAGKAHPNDQGGKELIKQIVDFARDSEIRDRVVFIEGYNMNIARYLVQGVDVWLNTPRRPMEASGTSGMKAAANGGLNLSVLDGWWDEGYTTEVGWAIGHGEQYDDTEYQDEVEANALYKLLETSVVPLFYDRGRDHLPRGWIDMMKASISQLAPFFNTGRMVQEYNEKFYMPAKRHYESLSADGFSPARQLAEWKAATIRSWPNVAVESVRAVDPDNVLLTVGSDFRVEAILKLGDLRPQDVRVEMYIGKPDEYRRIRDGATTLMSVVEDLGKGRHLFRGVYPCPSAGHKGLGIRVIPHHDSLATKYEMGLVLWAQDPVG